MAELPTEEGYVYGAAPKQPRPPPDIHGVFEAIGVPKGKLGELPHPKEWYDTAKERKAAREIVIDQLYAVKDELRQEWCKVVIGEMDDWGERVDQKLKEKGALGGLVELLARSAHERPFDEARIDILEDKVDIARTNMVELTRDMQKTRKHMRDNETCIREKEEVDKLAEVARVEEKKAADARKKAAEKILARQAALLRGEELPESDDEEGQEPEAGDAADAAGGAAGESPNSGRPPSGYPQPPSYLTSQAPPVAPVPELRGGLARQLPPLETSPPKTPLRPDSKESGSHSRR